MVREYTKYECESCHLTFNDRKEAEEHERVCMDEAANLADAKKLIGKCYSRKSPEGTLDLFRVKDAELDFVRGRSTYRKTILYGLCVLVFPGFRCPSEIRIIFDDIRPEYLKDWTEIDEDEYLLSIRRNIASMYGDGDYTMERRVLFGDMTVDDVMGDISDYGKKNPRPKESGPDGSNEGGKDRSSIDGKSGDVRKNGIFSLLDRRCPRRTIRSCLRTSPSSRP